MKCRHEPFQLFFHIGEFSEQIYLVAFTSADFKLLFNLYWVSIYRLQKSISQNSFKLCPNVLSVNNA